MKMLGEVVTEACKYKLETISKQIHVQCMRNGCYGASTDNKDNSVISK